MDISYTKRSIVSVLKLMVYCGYEKSQIKNVLTAIFQIIYSGMVRKEDLFGQILNNVPELQSIVKEKTQTNQSSQDSFIAKYCETPNAMIKLFADSLNDKAFLVGVDTKSFDALVDSTLCEIYSRKQ